MTKLQTLMRSMAACGTMLLVSACSNPEPELTWQPVSLIDAGLEIQFPCEPQFARTPVDFGMDAGRVLVNMTGCDAVDSTFAVSHWLLDEPARADEALAFWQAATLTQFKTVDGQDKKSGAPFVPAGALDLPRSIVASVEGVGRAGWTVTTHGAWFARQEGAKVRIFHAVVYAPKAYHQNAQTFFDSIVLK